MPLENITRWDFYRVSVQGVESLGGHFATLCRDFYEVKKNIIIFQNEKGNTFRDHS